LHSSLRLDLVWFLHSDSPFLGQEKFLPAYQGFERGVATFYDLPGIPYPTTLGDFCQLCARRPLAARPASAVFLSYTWGRSQSPAYAFKVRKDFDDGLRKHIIKAFGWLAYKAFSSVQDEAVVIGVPPRTTFQWGMQDHLNDLLLALEQTNFQILRRVLAFDQAATASFDLVVEDSENAQHLRGVPVILVDNLWNSGRTAVAVGRKLFELGAREVHLCIMGRWIEGYPEAIRAAIDYRHLVCPDPRYVHRWYYEQAFGTLDD
ncbi:MAG: hypothetical protein HY013_20415, partial [Candidatus Solibacter usitatus]|nr:hypothetical protein [Candidatus Solibacter usitatus]